MIPAQKMLSIHLLWAHSGALRPQRRQIPSGQGPVLAGCSDAAAVLVHYRIDGFREPLGPGTRIIIRMKCVPLRNSHP
jgi:hypothetical protein